MKKMCISTATNTSQPSSLNEAHARYLVWFLHVRTMILHSTHRANVIYRGISQENPGDSYIGETKQIVDERWKQHEDPSHDSAPSRHLREHQTDRFTWSVLTSSSQNWLKRKIHEALFIRKLQPSLNRQVEHHKLLLFRNGVT